MSNLYLHTPRVPLHGSRHYVSTLALNGQTALQSVFRHYVVFAKKKNTDTMMSK